MRTETETSRILEVGLDADIESPERVDVGVGSGLSKGVQSVMSGACPVGF
jgi:hypothetical protein